MICASCGEAASADPCQRCGEAALVDGRYRLEAPIGHGSAGTTWRAVHVPDGATVAVKEMPLRRADSLKARELLQREARVLRQLHHAGVPRWIDDVETGAGRHRTLWIVQEHVDGRTLAEEMADCRFTEDEVLAIVEELLGILRYLHGLSPPVVHRDVKPGNVMSRPDGSLVLIDFGAVRDVVKGDLGGSTIAGTFGFMAPEQLHGDACPATDLYAVGAVAVALLTRREPHTLLDHANRLQWEGLVRVHPATAALVRHLVEPDLAKRVASAEHAIERVRGVRQLLIDERRHLDEAPTVPRPRPGPFRPGPRPEPATVTFAPAVPATDLFPFQPFQPPILAPGALPGVERRDEQTLEQETLLAGVVLLGGSALLLAGFLLAGFLYTWQATG